MKFGGSLLVRADWVAGLAALLEGEPRPQLIVVGGGAVVDGLRAIDAAAAQPAAVMHSLAIDAMRITATLVADALRLPLVTRPDAGHPVAVLDAGRWLAGAGRATALPTGWHVTSDSIAAAVAGELAADLMLVKSGPPPLPGDDLEGLAATGWVDDHFPTAANGLSAIDWAAPRAEPR